MTGGLMQVELVPHPDLPHPDIRISVEVTLRPATLGLSYRLAGAIDEIVLPAALPPSRADKLWEHSCFEAFLRAVGDEAYFEFNFAPSRQWAMYRFDRYREAMREVTELAVPRIADLLIAEGYELHPVIYPQTDRPSLLGLSAVIEEQDGRKSYWALAHPPGKPDFHHPDCFVLELPAAG